MKKTGKKEKRSGIASRISERLKNQEGASLMAALLFFVFCGVGASIILASASSSAGKIKRLPREDQKRYAVDSAAEFLRDELQKPENVVKIKEVYTTHELCGIDDTDEVTYYYAGNGGDGQAFSASQEAVLDSLIKSLYQPFRENGRQENDGQENDIRLAAAGDAAGSGDTSSGDDDSLSKEFTLSVKPKSGKSSLDLTPLKVKAVLTMYPGTYKYKIQVRLSDTVTSDEKQEEQCERMLTLTPIVEVRDNRDNPDKTSHTISAGTKKDEEECEITKITYLTTISWKDGSCVIKKELLDQSETE